MASERKTLASNQYKQCSRIQDSRELLSRIPTKVVFQWVPSHFGFCENEMVDLLAKRSTDCLQRSTGDLPLHSAKLEINRISKEYFQDAAQNNSWKVLAEPNCVSDSPGAGAEL
ncbi:hypothetical protein TNCV_210121 [Trichonephila clavipes]|uniref:RNase H type-1 domain-containing protein n=1 Tax=Trichonephila clavipes TaxID=2585209 RepID=A0A8X6SYK1_TRICX|nr:hypothetical protein TNCV_210121 [Trichonephila clavipes]